MASIRPDFYPEWCSQGVEPTDKARPSESKRQYGQGYQQALFRQDINWQWDNNAKWIEYLDKRVATDDIYMTADASKTEAQVEDQMGGQWVSLGTLSIGGSTVHTFRRTGD